MAEKLDRSRPDVAARAIEDCVARDAWRLAEIEAALIEADLGDFGSQTDVADGLARYAENS